MTTANLRQLTNKQFTGNCLIWSKKTENDFCACFLFYSYHFSDQNWYGRMAPKSLRKETGTARGTAWWLVRPIPKHILAQTAQGHKTPLANDALCKFQSLKSTTWWTYAGAAVYKSEKLASEYTEILRRSGRIRKRERERERAVPLTFILGACEEDFSMLLVWWVSTYALLWPSLLHANMHRL